MISKTLSQNSNNTWTAISESKTKNKQQKNITCVVSNTKCRAKSTSNYNVQNKYKLKNRNAGTHTKFFILRTLNHHLVVFTVGSCKAVVLVSFVLCVVLCLLAAVVFFVFFSCSLSYCRAALHFFGL